MSLFYQIMFWILFALVILLAYRIGECVKYMLQIIEADNFTKACNLLLEYVNGKEKNID